MRTLNSSIHITEVSIALDTCRKRVELIDIVNMLDVVVALSQKQGILTEIPVIPRKFPGVPD